MSAQANLAGLYPPKGDQIWHENIQWQPIPIRTVPEKLDYWLNSVAPCEAHEYLMKKLINTDEFITIRNKYKLLFEYIAKHSGQPINTLQDVENVHDTLLVELSHNKT